MLKLRIICGLRIFGVYCDSFQVFYVHLLQVSVKDGLIKKITLYSIKIAIHLYYSHSYQIQTYQPYQSSTLTYKNINETLYPSKYPFRLEQN